MEKGSIAGPGYGKSSTATKAIWSVYTMVLELSAIGKDAIWN